MGITLCEVGVDNKSDPRLTLAARSYLVAITQDFPRVLPLPKSGPVWSDLFKRALSHKVAPSVRRGNHELSSDH